MGTKWTPQQEQAIGARNKSILVSAAAGSGKTAVMVERITQMILDGTASLDEMLIVTFTNAAAQEMKEKIRKAIRAKAKEDPAMRHQLELLPRAGISTFHSFALNVIRQNFYLIGLEPSFRIADEGRIALMQEEVLDELFDAEYEKKGPAFYEFLDWYSTEKSDDQAREILKELYRHVESLPDPFATLEAAVQDLSQANSFADLSVSDDLMQDIRQRTFDVAQSVAAMYNLLNQCNCPVLAEKLTLVLEYSGLALKYAEEKNLAGVQAKLEQMVFPRLVSTKAEKDKFNLIKPRIDVLNKNAKEGVKALQEIYFAKPEDALFADLHATAPMGEEILALIREFDRRFAEKKREEKLIDFGDIEHMCLEILRHPEAVEIYRNKYQYIFIDEYQDTSLIQEAIVQQIAREDNLFMVGDVKQCIYQFRLAEPDIFRNKYAAFSEADPEDPRIKIDLNRNFRSRPVLLEEMNRLFEPIMDGYDKNAKLYPGKDYDGEYSFDPHLYLIEKPDISEDGEDEEDAGDPLVMPENREVEAREVARLIRENVGTIIEDGKTDEKRPLRYRDIVILVRSVTGTAPIYDQVMKEAGIPFYFDDSEGFFDRVEITVFLNLLSVIDNRYQDVPLLSVLRSEIFGFSVEELAAIRAYYPEYSYAEAFFLLAEEGNPENLPEEETKTASPRPLATSLIDDSWLDLPEEEETQAIDDADAAERRAMAGRCYEAAAQINAWKAYSMALPLPDLIWKVLRESRYFMMAGAMPDGNMRQANLRILADRAEQYRENSEGTLYSFVRYLAALKKQEVNTGQAKLIAENDDVVRMMTIHKSKGLEFPMVIVAGMGMKLKYGGGSADVKFDKNIGLGLSLVDKEQHTSVPTILSTLIAARKRQSEFEEQIRILYVAMTRAREKLYMTGVVKDAQKFLDEKESGKRGPSTYLDILSELPETSIVRGATLVPGLADGVTEESPEAADGAEIAEGAESGDGTEENLTEPGEEAVRTGSEESTPKLFSGMPDEDLKNEVFRRLDYRYPFAEAANIRSKYTVSAMNRLAQSEQEFYGGEGAGGPVSPKAGRRIASDEEPGTAFVPEAAGKEIHFEVPLFLQNEKPLTAAEKGTVYHGILERMDFGRAAEEGEAYLEGFVRGLVEKDIFFEKEMESIDLHKLVEFAQSDIGRRAQAAAQQQKLFREQPFNLAVRKLRENLMIQGVIDCFFEEEDGLVLVDYKSNRVDRRRPEQECERLKQQYREQISLYREALEKGMKKPVKESYLYLLDAGMLVNMEG